MFLLSCVSVGADENATTPHEPPETVVFELWICAF